MLGRAKGLQQTPGLWSAAGTEAAPVYYGVMLHINGAWDTRSSGNVSVLLSSLL